MDPTKLKELMDQAQTMAQSLQGDMVNTTAEGSAGGDLVKAKVNGQNQLVQLKIDPTIIDPKDPDMLEDMVRAAVNQAFARLRESMNEELQRRTGGMMPGIFS